MEGEFYVPIEKFGLELYTKSSEWDQIISDLFTLIFLAKKAEHQTTFNTMFRGTSCRE